MHEFKEVGDVEKEATENATCTTSSSGCCYLFCVKFIVCHKKQLPKFFLEAVFVYSLTLPRLREVFLPLNKAYIFR